ncbi:pentapeptide repeat-containing protein [Vibrio astriarenae]
MPLIKNNEEYYDQQFDKHTVKGETLLETVFEECEFIDCDFSDAVFRRCRFVDCSFVSCNLSLVQFSLTQFLNIEFRQSKLVGVDWTKADWPTFRADPEMRFFECILNGSSFYGLTLQEIKFDQCQLVDVDFREADLSQAQMTECDLNEAQFMRTNLTGTDLTDSHSFTMSVLDNQLKGAQFSRLEALNLLESLGVKLVD